MSEAASRPEGFQRVSAALAQRGHPHAPVWLDVAAQTGAVGRADADFVKATTGFTIGGVSPVGHAVPTVQLIDADLFRFDLIWAAAGHPNGVFALSPQQLVALTNAPVCDVVVAS